MLRYSRGLSLIELLITMGICLFLALRVLEPWWLQIQQRKQIDLMMLELQQLVSMARMSAITENSIVTLCRSNDGRRCQGRWMDGSILFTDRNGDHILNQEDRLLFRVPPPAPDGELRFNAFRNRQYLQLTPQGVTAFQNGNFTWCPTSGDLRLVRQLIVSFSGKTRMALDTNGDGIVENSQGKPPSCS